jgi:hypothetical protein
MQLSNFLKKVLPHDGIYCATAITPEEPKAKVRNQFLGTTEDCANWIQSQNGKANLYHACASYKTPGKRTKDNVHSLRALWADIDIRDDKGYKTFEDAFHGLHNFLIVSKLPVPTTVFSGNGIHVYWTLKQDIDIQTWEKYANGLKAYAINTGFKIDAGITADAARILRSPGTINLKWNKESKILNIGEDCDISQFTVVGMQRVRAPVVAEVEKKEKKDFTLVDAEKIFAGCAQLRLFKEGWQEQTGEHWIACGRIIAQCDGGEKIWHTLSEQDPRYNENEAAKKWHDSLKFNNATTCARFKELNPEGCVGCTFRGKTPIGLARGKPVAKEYTEEVVKKLEESNVPFGYSFNAAGALVVMTKDGEERDKEIEISNYPFVVKDRTTGDLVFGERSFIVEHWTPQEGWKEGELTLVEFTLNPTAALAKIGVLITNPNLTREYVRKSINKLAKEKAMIKVHDTFGWKGDKFLLGDRLYSYDDGKLVFETVHLGAEARQLAPHLRPGGMAGRGSIQGWQAAAQGLFARGHEWQAISLIAGAAAPLLALLGDVEGGTIWSLFDPVGGKGKSTSIIAGATIWGSFEGLSTNASDTINARMAKLGTLRNLPFAYDEMRRDNPGIAKQFVQTFTAGTERARMDKNGGLSKTPRSWRTIMLTSANTELVGAIAADDGSEAMSDRVFEIHADSLPLRRGEINGQLKEQFLENCGYAALVVVGYMLKGLTEIKINIKEREKHYMNLLHDSKLRFRAQFIAAIDVMANLLADSKMLVFDPNDYITFLLEHINDNTEISRIASASEMLSRYLREMQSSTVHTVAFKPGQSMHIVPETKTGRVDVRIEKDSKHIIIPRKDLHTWLQERDRSIKAFIKELTDNGVLLGKNIKKNLGAGTQYASGQESVLIFKADHEELTGFDNIIPLTPTQSPAASSLRLAALAKR